MTRGVGNAQCTLKHSLVGEDERMGHQLGGGQKRLKHHLGANAAWVSQRDPDPRRMFQAISASEIPRLGTL
jgi:hypothetical protein